MFYRLFLFFFLCTASSGSKPLTFNGKDSHASLKVGNITSGYLSFDLQTRQASSFILGCYDSANPLNGTNYFVVAINEKGILSISANYSGNAISLPGKVVCFLHFLLFGEVWIVLFNRRPVMGRAGWKISVTVSPDLCSLYPVFAWWGKPHQVPAGVKNSVEQEIEGSFYFSLNQIL